jgi:hypothetical protein
MPMTFRRLLRAVVLVFFLADPVQAIPSRTQWGVTYWPPQDTLIAIRDLHAIREAGFQWVELLRPAEPTLLFWCERLGLRVFYRLIETDRPGSLLETALPDLQRQLVARLERVRTFSCIAAWGLGGPDDPADPRLRRTLRILYRLIRERDNRPVYRIALPGLGAIPEGWTIWDYTAPRTKALDRLPSGSMVRLGHPVRGWLRWPLLEASPQRAWSNLWADLKTLTSLEPVLIWVHTWRDYRADRPSLRLAGIDPWDRPYGLLGPDGLPRPALDGLRSWIQESVGPEPPAPDQPPPSLPWAPVALMLLAFLGLYYRHHPELGRFLKRYVQVHRIFLEDVFQDRERTIGWQKTGLILVSLSVGLIALVGYTMLQHAEATDRFWGGLRPSTPGAALIRLIGQNPWVFGLLGALCYLIDHSLWLLLLRLSIQPEWRPPLRTIGLLLVLAHWSLPLLALFVLLAASIGVSTEIFWLGLWGLAGLLFLAGRVQAVMDATLPTTLPLPVVGLAGIGLPLLYYGLLGSVIWYRWDLSAYLSYFWRSL